MPFAPHVICLRNDPQIIAAFLLGDGMTSVAYKLIPLALALLVWWRRRELERSWRVTALLALFAAFITCCGLGHDLALWNLWHGDYRLESAWAVVTGLVSILTAFTLCWFLPTLRTLPLPGQAAFAVRRVRALLREAERLEAEGQVSPRVLGELRAAARALDEGMGR